jgi:hypothetical protein
MAALQGTEQAVFAESGQEKRTNFRQVGYVAPRVF